MKMPSKQKRSKVDEQIDENLKRVYADALGEKLPDRFLDLIEKLKATEASGAKDHDAK